MYSLLQRLSKHTPSDYLTQVLINVRSACRNITLHSDLKKFESALVLLCCQNSNMLHWNHAGEREGRRLNLDLAFEILLYLSSLKRYSRQRIVEMLLAHAYSHTSCYVTLLVVFKLQQASYETLTLLRKGKWQNLLNLWDVIISKTSEAKDIRQMSEWRRKDKGNTTNYTAKVHEYLSAIGKPQEFYDTPSMEISSKIPPLLLPSSKSISSSRYSVGSRYYPRKAMHYLFKLGSSLGEATMGVEFGCLLAKRRISQINKFSYNHELHGLNSQTYRDLSARGVLPDDIESIANEVDDEEVYNKHHRKSLVMLANILLKCIEKEHYEDELANVEDWLGRVLDLLMSNAIPQFSIDSCLPKKPQLDDKLLPKHIVFGRLLNICGMQSEHIHLVVTFAKNLPLTASQYKISDGLLGKVTLDRHRLSKRLLTRMQIKQLDHDTMVHVRNQSNKLLVWIKHMFCRVFETFYVGRHRTFNTLQQLLAILDNYLKNTDCKIAPYEIVEHLMEYLLVVKRILLEMSLPYMKKNSTFSTYQLEMSGKMSSTAGKFSKKSKYYSSQHLTKAIILEFPLLMSSYLGVVTGTLTSQKHLERLFIGCLLKNTAFLTLVYNFVNHLFYLDESEQIIKCLNFYRKLAQVYHSRKTRNTDDRPLNTILNATGYLFNLKNGLVTKYLMENDPIITNLLESSQIINPNSVRKLLFFRYLLNFTQEMLNFGPENNPLLHDDISCFFLKFCFINFVRLYSYLTVSYLESIQELFRSGEALTSPLQILQTQQTQILSSHQSYANNYYKQSMMVGFLQILINMSIQRTEELSKKMRYYRILEFFTRYLELYFCLRDYRHRLVKTDKPKSTDKKQPYKVQQTGKKPFIPSLALKTKTVEEDPEENKPTRKAIPPVKIPYRISTLESDPRKKYGCLDGILDEISKESRQATVPSLKGPIIPAIKLSGLKAQDDKKPQLALNLHNIDQLKEQARKPYDDRKIYLRERRIRKIYGSRTIHSSAVLLVLSLLLKKGLLDPAYCDQHPIMNGKINVLYILHHHLNHESNYSILSHLTEGVSRIQPYPSGQRLLKLLASPFTNTTLYTDWEKLAEGAYGLIFSCRTNLAMPSQLAIKQMSLPESIYGRCVLNDIFTEISCLYNFRLYPHITDVYDYGVTESNYVIVMKKYPFSLRQWRKMQKNPSLSTLLGIFKEILKVVKLLHHNSVTHYDIKADNILLDCYNYYALEEGKFAVVFGDFGYCKIYDCYRYELDLRPRGTECNKSPEMLTVSSKMKRNYENFDRRRKIGTTKASDIWSLGCLFYELMTGDYLFDASMWTVFFLHVTSDKKELLQYRYLEGLNHNIYLIDFLKFILIREPQHRPSIDNIIKRFDNIYALLVPNDRVRGLSTTSPLQFNYNLYTLLYQYMNLIMKNHYVSSGNIPTVANCISTFASNTSIQSKRYNHKINGLLRIMEDIYFCDYQYFNKNKQNIIHEGISHVVATFPVCHFFSLTINNESEQTVDLPFRLAARVSDFLREVLIYKGKLLFVNSESNYAVILLIYCLSLWFRCTIFETWCLINTQILEFPISTGHLPILSQALYKLNKIEQQIEKLSKLQCICGSVTFILKRAFMESKDVRMCKCKRKEEGCVSPNCSQYLYFLKKRFNIYWDHLKWDVVTPNNFLVGPMRGGRINDPVRVQILINSAEPTYNMVEMDGKCQDKIWKCRVCDMWMLGQSATGKIWILMNNLIKSIRQGIMIPNAQQNFRMRTPILNTFTLAKLHMISQ